jgi:hypothetical protein
MMSKILRALLISAVATAAAVAAVAFITGRPFQLTNPLVREPEGSGKVDADDLSDEEAALLMKEMDTQA